MANNALALRMKYRKFSVEQLNEVINNSESSELEIKIANEALAKLGVGKETSKEEPKEEKKAPKKPAKKVAKKVEETEEETVEEQAAGSDKNPMKDVGNGVKVAEIEPENKLSKEEEILLKDAEKEFDERQAKRKTPSKKDKSMASEEKTKKEEKTIRETKRQNLEESTEVAGLKVGSKVCLKGSSTVGEITRIYISSDGKEKCMVKFGDDKPVKKRVTALELKK